MNTIVTFDLHGGAPGDYERAHGLLASMGFARVVATNTGRPVPFPGATAIGTLEEGLSPRQVKRFIWARFRAAGLRVRRIFAAKFRQEGFWAMCVRASSGESEDLAPPEAASRGEAEAMLPEMLNLLTGSEPDELFGPTDRSADR